MSADRNLFVRLQCQCTDLLCYLKLHLLMSHSLNLILIRTLNLIRTLTLTPWSRRWQIQCQSGSLPALAGECPANHTMRSCHHCVHPLPEIPPTAQMLIVMRLTQSLSCTTLLKVIHGASHRLSPVGGFQFWLLLCFSPLLLRLTQILQLRWCPGLLQRALRCPDVLLSGVPPPCSAD